MKVRTVLLKEKELENQYNNEQYQDLLQSINGSHIMNSSNSKKVNDVVGIVDFAEFIEDEGIVIESTVFDDDVYEKVDRGLVHIIPSLIVNQSEKIVEESHKLFFGLKSDEIVGETEPIE